MFEYLGFLGSLWRFFEAPNVPPTNNHAERQLRPLVISKKLTFGTQSDREVVLLSVSFRFLRLVNNNNITS